MRLCYFTFLSKPLGHRKIICFISDSNIQICFVLSCLAIPSILIGFILKDMIVGIGSNFFGANIFINLKNLNIYDSEFISVFYKILPVNLSLLGLFSAFVFYNFKSKFLYYFKVSFYGKKIYYFLNRKWFIDKIYNDYINQFFYKYAFYSTYKFIDRGIFEILGPTGLSIAALKIGSNIHKMQTGIIYHYTSVLLKIFYG